MRVKMIWLCGLLAACGGGAVTVPSTGVYEVPQGGTASSAGGVTDFTTTIEGALAEPTPDGLPPHTPGATLPPSPDGTGRALDDDQINLMQWTLEQQKVDAAIAERELLDARSRLVVVQPGPLPDRTDGVNIALFAKQTTNGVGERRYDRSAGARVASAGNCGRFRDADAAQRAFLAGGGPERDRYGVDPDGDGFACRWDPAPYRALN
jgi:hypothetical protein